MEDHTALYIAFSASVLQYFSASARHEMTRGCSVPTFSNMVDPTTRAQPPKLTPVRHASSSCMSTIPTTITITGSDGPWGTNVPQANSRDFLLSNASLYEVSGGHQPSIQKETMESSVFVLDNSTTIDSISLPPSLHKLSLCLCFRLHLRLLSICCFFESHEALRGGRLLLDRGSWIV